MKHQQVVVDYWSMVKSSGLCLLLAVSGYVLLKMVQTIFWLPGHLKKNQERLEVLAKQYGKDLNDDERAEMEKLFKSETPLTGESLKELLDKSLAEEPKKEL